MAFTLSMSLATTFSVTIDGKEMLKLGRFVNCIVHSRKQKVNTEVGVWIVLGLFLPWLDLSAGCSSVVSVPELSATSRDIAPESNRWRRTVRVTFVIIVIFSLCRSKNIISLRHLICNKPYRPVEVWSLKGYKNLIIAWRIHEW